jgi:prepilin-type N-terminal cleavage/methylation domain-containing protein
MAQPIFQITSLAADARRRARDDAGFTLVELLVSIVILTVGVLSLMTVLASSNAATGTSESQQAEIHRAQKEIERIQALPYNQIALTSAPTPSANTHDPNYYVSGSASCPNYQWNQATGATNTDALVINGCNSVSGGTITAGPQAWSDSSGRSGNFDDYITWVTDNKCSPGCPASNDFKRITVAITTSKGAPYKPILISATIADPHATPGANPIAGGGPIPITCTNAQGQTVSCSVGIPGQTVGTWHLTDSGTCGVAPLLDSVTHTTLTLPDLLCSAPPTGTTCHNYSTDQGSPDPCGRVLKPDVSCGSTPSNDNTKSEFWTTPPQTTALTLNGNGGMTLNTQTVGGVQASITLCVAIYDVSPLSFLSLITIPPIKLGVVAYTLAQWPTTSTPVSFNFNFLGSGTAVIPLGDRIGVRIWVAGGVTPIQAQYDGVSADSVVQLTSQ